MRLVYVGTHDAVDVIDAGCVAHCNEPVEIPDDVAVRLLEQRDNWSKAPTQKGGK